MRRLIAGQTVRVPGEATLYRVIRVTQCSATVAPIAARHVEIETEKGVVSWEAPGRRIEWSPYAHVEVVEEQKTP